MATAIFPAWIGEAARPRRTLWLAGLAIAAALHAGGFAYIWSTAPPAEPDEALGAPAIEIGVELASPKQEETNLPPGPEAEDAAASSPSAAQTAKPQDLDLPKETPVETDDPARVVAPERPETPKEENPKITESKADKAAESVASEAAAPPKIEKAREAETAVAPAQGTGEAALLIKTTWQKHLAAHLNRFKRYPHNGAQHAMEVTVTFTLDRLGHVVNAVVDTSSGDPAFDQAALDMMKRADPVPAPPPLVADETLTFALPVIFKVRH